MLRNASHRAWWRRSLITICCLLASQGRQPLLEPGEGNGSPLQHSCLENPRDRGVWWAAVSGVAQSWTRLKRLSSTLSLYKAMGTGYSS